MKLILVGGSFLAGAGCAQHRYAARDLPCEYQAAPIINPRTLDLSRLAGPSLSSDFIAPGDVLSVSIAGGMTSIAGLEAEGVPYATERGAEVR